MRKPSNRLDKIGDAIKQELARLIQHELRDPRLGMVSVTDAKVSRDLSHADAYVTTLATDQMAALAVLNKASGLLRTMLAKNLQLRATPRLKFHYDHSVDRGRHLSSLIDKAIAADSQHEKSADE
jgi:ribosome-binding factor A